MGPTGCGKTTLINLLMRFYDVNGGSIKVSGTDIRDVTRASLRGSYGMVLQDTWLRAGTVRENIAYGKPDATLEEMVAAAKAAHADSFIRRLPEGYDTVIAEDGGNISQGQKQLLCIARVMLCLPPMLILDEATSSIDTRTEVRIQKAFARMMQGRTSFIVAHRLSTIREADVILVMKDGHIVEQGRPRPAAGGKRLLRQAVQQPVRGRGDLKRALAPKEGNRQDIASRRFFLIFRLPCQGEKSAADCFSRRFWGDSRRFHFLCPSFVLLSGQDNYGGGYVFPFRLKGGVL